MSATGSSNETMRFIGLTHKQAVMLHYALYMAWGNDGGGVLRIWQQFREAMGPTWDQVCLDSSELMRKNGK